MADHSVASCGTTLLESEPTLNEGRRYRRFKVKNEAWLEVDILASFWRGVGMLSQLVLDPTFEANPLYAYFYDDLEISPAKSIRLLAKL